MGYTKGQWSIARGLENVVIAGRTAIAILFHDGDIEYEGMISPESDERLANAQIISAAPDLLEALERIEQCYGNDAAYPFDLMSAALAKARGSSTD